MLSVSQTFTTFMRVKERGVGEWVLFKVTQFFVLPNLDQRDPSPTPTVGKIQLISAKSQIDQR